MAYQNVGTPRFYVNVMEYLATIGAIPPIDSKRMTLPVLPVPVEIHQAATQEVFNTMSGGKNFLAALNAPPSPEPFQIRNDEDEFAALNDVVNMGGEHEGFRIATFSEDIETVSVNAFGGSIIIGSYYDMPHSPDLNLKLTYEYDGVKNITTKGGATLSNASYFGTPNWGDGGAWQLSSTLEDGTQSAVPSNLRSGRRVWDLSFSYLSDTDVFPVNASQSSAAYTEDGYHTATNNPTTGFADIIVGQFQSNILDGQDFFSVVWNRTMGGHLPFIFQPDGSNNNPDQFAICRFDMDSLKYDQVANNTYNVKLKIRESW